ncbi:MAG: PilZ domain-containing protein [Candidatus Zixiibacteriota bacterium]
MSDPRLKIISDVEAGENIVSVKSPFKIQKEQKRRFIRLEISEPTTYSVLRDHLGGFFPQGDGPEYQGAILNISAGGVLLTSQDPMEEGAIVLIKMTLQDVELIDRIIGIVKRAEADEKDWLIGIEFISKENLSDYFSDAEFDLLPDNIASFNERLRSVLNKYIYFKRVSAEK